ncbi:MAG: hypothetical protein CL912_30360 [Deltaproteobacteria bacterium]|nr:hypothetical protein [Deltaproteobacteria bacterium]
MNIITYGGVSIFLLFVMMYSYGAVCPEAGWEIGDYSSLPLRPHPLSPDQCGVVWQFHGRKHVVLQ